MAMGHGQHDTYRQKRDFSVIVDQKLQKIWILP